MSTQIDRIAELAKEEPKRRFLSIAHLITPEALYAAFLGLRKKASAGEDGVTYEKYEKDATRDIQQLHERLKEGKYRASCCAGSISPRKMGSRDLSRSHRWRKDRAEGNGRGAERHL